MKENFEFATLAFFKGTNIESFNKAVKKWYAKDLSEKNVVISDEPLHLQDYFTPPYGGEMEAFSWWTSANYPGLIFLSSDEIDGASSLCYNLRRGLHCEVYEWSFSNGTDSPMSRMQYTDKNGEVRVVMAYMDDPRWVFYQSGKLLPFEDESNYSRRFIKKRLNFDIQKQYLSRMGISLSNIDGNVTSCKTLKRVAWGEDDIFDEDSWVDPFADDSRVCQNEAGGLTTK